MTYISGQPEFDVEDSTADPFVPTLAGVDHELGEWRFPEERFEELIAEGALPGVSAPARTSFQQQIALTRAVARSDGSVGRVLAGHLSGLERMLLLGSRSLVERQLAEISAQGMLIGVWVADLAADEGSAATLRRHDRGWTIEGSKVLCFGAGVVKRALVSARDEDGACRLALIDASERLEIDRGWYCGSGLLGAQNHLVGFSETPVLDVLGGADELTREPWCAREALRIIAVWLGLADAIAAATLSAVAGASVGAGAELALADIQVARATMVRWVDHSCAALGDLEALDLEADRLDPALLAVECRMACAGCARTISAQAAAAVGPLPSARDARLDRARRDLDALLLQNGSVCGPQSLGRSLAGRLRR